MLNTYCVRGGNTTTNNTTNIDAINGTIVASTIDSFFFTCEIGDTMFDNLMGFNPYVIQQEKQLYTTRHGYRDYNYVDKEVPVRIVQSMILPNGHMMFEVIKVENSEK